ncbi:hypothetical protein Zmor_008753, partial [Zophobas morio]
GIQDKIAQIQANIMEHKKKLTNSTGCDPPLNKTTPGVDITSGNGVPQSSYTDAVDLTGTNSSSYPLSELSLASIQKGAKVMPKTWKLNERGELVDEAGRVITVDSRVQTLKANLRAKVETEPKPVEEVVEEPKDEFYDPRIVEKPTSARIKQGLKFIERGVYERAGEKMRHQQQIERLQEEIAATAKKTGISAATKLALLTPNNFAVTVVPDVEWWDAPLLKTGTYDNFEPTSLDLRKIEVVTDLVEHPELIDPPIIEKKLPVPIYLTKEERIKIRRQRRREAELEKREKIRMGLVLPDDPKLKLSNFMRSKTDEAVLAPSSLESSVRKQMEVRLQAGILHNELNKLTKEQRSEKKTKRLMEDTSQKAHIAVFRLNHMKNSKNRYKVDINAQQFKLTGRIITSPDVCIVIAEGGPKNIKKYKKLLLNRIKWAEEDLAEPAGPSESGGFVKNECRLVWEGTVKRRAFGNWKVKSFSSSSQAREHLTRFHVEHYWDLGITEAIMEMENIDEAE